MFSTDCRLVLTPTLCECQSLCCTSKHRREYHVELCLACMMTIVLAYGTDLPRESEWRRNIRLCRLAIAAFDAGDVRVISFYA